MYSFKLGACPRQPCWNIGETVAARIGDSRAAFHASSSYTPESPGLGLCGPPAPPAASMSQSTQHPGGCLPRLIPAAAAITLANKRRRRWRRREGGKEGLASAMDAALLLPAATMLQALLASSCTQRLSAFKMTSRPPCLRYTASIHFCCFCVLRVWWW